MRYIKGKYRKSIYETEAGYKIGLFRVLETNHKDIEINKTITFTGHFAELVSDVTYTFEGDLIYHDKYGEQFQVANYSKHEPNEKDAIMDFLTSNFIKGCGVKTAEKIYDKFGNDSLIKIKENKSNLLLVPTITEKRADTIYNSVLKYYESDQDIMYLQNLGFTIKETMKLIKRYDKGIKAIIDDNIYILNELIEFKKLDQIFLINNDKEDERRIEASIIDAMKKMTFSSGDIYLDKIEIVEYLANYYSIYSNLDKSLEKLSLSKKIINNNEDYYLIEDYLDEDYIAESIKKLINLKIKEYTNLDDNIETIAKKINIIYNEEQKLAIKEALINNISIITGGPGTGKTTIIKGIIKLYSKIHKLSEDTLNKDVLLLAPTGRAAKKMSDATGLNSSTIHRFLKWDKEDNSFGINEFNKVSYNLIIIDETSMIDNRLLSSLFKGIDLKTQIIFVGDEYQLPSVGPGLVLNDMINSKVITHTNLKNIYRQSENSYIPVLAKEIKDVNLSNEVLIKKDDYNFIEAPNNQIRGVIKQILDYAIKKGLNETNFQVLAPMYRGENGIDNLNILLQEIFNPKKHQKEIKIYNSIYREGDKVLNLVNDIDNNVFNGDVGYIKQINLNSKSDVIIVDYDNNLVSYKRDEIINITHAYAISIHKSQGSEYILGYQELKRV